jgi:low temperature requirement protein LtrA
MPSATSMNDEKSLLRKHHANGHSKVTFIELFFDLVFVFAVTRLSHSLMERFTPVGAAETLLLMLAVWWVWIYTSRVTNWLNPEKLPVPVPAAGHHARWLADVLLAAFRL